MKSKKRICRYLLSILILLLSLTGCKIFGDSGSGVEARTAIVFKILDGEGTVLEREEKEEAVYEGMRLVASDSIVTDDESSVYIRVDDDKNILLNTNSKMIIKELKSGKLVLELEYGNFFFDVENKLDISESMIFRIGSTSMSIRGTSGAGSKTEDDLATFAIYTGVGEITDDLGEGVVCTLEENSVVNFVCEDGAKEYVLCEVNEENVSNLVSEYAEENEEYREKLTGWEATEDDKVKPSSEKIETRREYYDVSKEGQFVLEINDDGKLEIKHTTDEEKVEEVKENNSSKVEEKEEEQEYITIVVDSNGLPKGSKKDSSNNVVVPEGYRQECHEVTKRVLVVSDDGESKYKNVKENVCELVEISKKQENKKVNKDTYDTSSSSSETSSSKVKNADETTERVTVTDRVINKPSAGKTSFKHDGTKKSPGISGFDSAFMFMDGTVSATDVGSYEVRISLLSGFHWSDGSSDTVVIHWQITEK